MIVERRNTFGVPSIVLIPTPEEARMLDEVFGSAALDDDGLISKMRGEYRMADGYGTAYVSLRKTPPDAANVW